MLINPHYVYGFKFSSLFEGLNGAYKVLAIYSYDELLSIDIDLYSKTFKPAEVDKEEYLSILNTTIKKGKIYKLEKMNDEAGYLVIEYIPESIIVGTPDSSVKRYYDMGLAISLGIFDDPEKLEIIRTQIKEIVEAQLGVEEESVAYAIRESWLTADEYKAIDDARKNHVISDNSDITINTDFLIKNNFTHRIELLKEVTRLQNIIQHYETLLINIT